MACFYQVHSKLGSCHIYVVEALNPEMDFEKGHVKTGRLLTSTEAFTPFLQVLWIHLVDVIGIVLRIDVDLEAVWLWQQADDVPVEADEEAADKAVEMDLPGFAPFQCWG